MRIYIYIYMDVSKNRGTPKSSILIGFSIINHPFWGTPIFGNTHIYMCVCVSILQKKVRLDGWTFDVVFVRGTSKSWTTAKVAPFDVQILS